MEKITLQEARLFAKELTFHGLVFDNIVFELERAYNLPDEEEEQVIEDCNGHVMTVDNVLQEIIDSAYTNPEYLDDLFNTAYMLDMLEEYNIDVYNILKENGYKQIGRMDGYDKMTAAIAMTLSNYTTK